MIRTIGALVTGMTLGICGATVAHQHAGSERVKPLAAIEIQEKFDTKELKATVVEVTLEAGDAGSPHRHPGPVFGYVLEGQYELGIDDQPAKVLKQGEAFYEPSGCLHRVSKNPAEKGKTRVLAWVVHPRDAHQVAIPEVHDK